MLTHIAVCFYLHILVCMHYYVTLIASSDNTSTSEHHSASQDVLPESDQTTVHSTPLGM